MKLSELIAQVGDENAEVQRLADSVVSASAGKNQAKITFVTDRDKGQDVANSIVMGLESRKYVGLVVWLPADKIPECLKDRV